jgi:hypothetical protein
MLSTLLSQISALQGFFSKYFVLGSFCPVLAAVFLNGLAGYFVFDDWHAFVDANLVEASFTAGTLTVTSLAVGLALAAYVLSSLSTFLRQVLEGKGAVWSWIGPMFIPAQNRRRAAMIAGLEKAGMDLIDLRDSADWLERLRLARAEGTRLHPRAKINLPAAITETLAQYERRRAQHKRLEIPQLEALVGEIETQLKAGDADADATLAKQQERVVKLVHYAENRTRQHQVRLQNELNSNYGLQDVAPTRMGNIANATQSYALRRYHCNLDSIWSNLQIVAETDKNWPERMQTAKAQLDFMVACVWLSVVSSIGWMVAFTWLVPGRIGLAVVALLGPGLAYVWYRAATEQYRSFSDLMMTTLDTFRLNLLQAMRLPLPADVEEEREIWNDLDRLSTFGEIRNFRYKHPTES